MKIIEQQWDFKLDKKSAVAIGKFDGVHLGHRRLLHQILEQKENGCQAVVFTFDPTPAAFFTGKTQKELTTKAEKRRLFEQLGIDVLIEFPLNAETAATPAEQFVLQILCEQMKMKYITAGTDISFGDKGKGNADLLKALADLMDYEVDIIDKVMYGEAPISSTLIREQIESGNMAACKACLGDYYQVSGVVMPGKKLGRTLGMPTVNVHPEEQKLLPPNGVYYSNVIHDGIVYPGITNIGYKPSASSEHIMGVETYIYDFEKDLYGQEIQVQLIQFKRPEMKFASIEMLKAQMESDIASGRVFHGLT